MKDVIIIGGGLAGLIAGLELSRAGLSVLLIEKKVYPFHKVCGEYISNEVLPYFKRLGINLDQLNVSAISRFMLSSPKGKAFQTKLDLGGFGISRYLLDDFLYKKNLHEGVEVLTGHSVEGVEFSDNGFEVTLNNGKKYYSELVIGSYGKRSKIDKHLNRSFIEKRSPYIAVKYHLKTDFPSDLIALHNFKDGYCGMSKVENDTYNLCYLSHRNNIKKVKNIKEMEELVLFKNPFLKNIFLNSEFLFKEPFVINEVSFERKALIENHVLMAGDAAGMITPLCGNGMAMAIHGAKILSQQIVRYFKTHRNRAVLEKSYNEEWKKAFNKRLLVGRTVQRTFGDEHMTEMMVAIFKSSNFLSNLVIRQTHGKPF